MKIHCSHFRSLNLIYEEVQPKITLEDCPPGGLSLWRTVPLEDRLPGGLSLEGCPPGELSLEGCPGGGPAARRIVPWRPWRTVLVEDCPAGGLSCWRAALLEDCPAGGLSWWRTVLVEDCPAGGPAGWRTASWSTARQPVKSSVGIITRQSHISQVSANADSVSD